MSDTQRGSDEIEQEIRQTRVRLDDTLHQIEAKFSPEQLMNTTYDYLRHGGAERAVSGLSRTLKENPLPVMVTGIGLGWLLLAQRGSHSGHRYPASLQDSQTTSGAKATVLGHDPAALGATPQYSSGRDDDAESMTDKAKHMVEGMRDRAGHLGEQVKEQTRHLGDHMRHGASHLDEQRHAAVDAASHRMHDASHQVSHFVQEHPLVAGALGVAAGAVLAGLFSPTRAENRHLGEMRDRVVHRAEEVGEEQLKRAGEKVHDTAQRIKEKAHASSSHGSGYVENPYSEERFAKAGAAGSTGAPNVPGSTPRKGDSGPQATPLGVAPTSPKGGGLTS